LGAVVDIIPLKLKDTFEVNPKVIGDSRGYFAETYLQAEFEEHGLSFEWVQENRSVSTKKHTLRGLHFQSPPTAQTKLVSVMQGRIFDVFIDIRKQSPTFGQWDAVELDGERCNAVLVPKGIAHGFCTLTERAVVHYKVDYPYSAESDRGIAWNDPDLEIEWPTLEPHLSDRDKALSTFADFESPF